MIVLKLQGGLGNQLFEYLGYQKLREYYDDVYLDVEDYDLPYNKNFRRFDLDSFDTIDLKLILFSDNKKKQLKYKLFFKNILVLPVSTKNKLKYMDLRNINLDDSIILSSDLNQIPVNSYVEAFFSRERFVSSWNQIFFSFKQEALCHNKSLLKKANELLNCNSVSVHIRRTDYLFNGNEKFQGVCTETYYKNAMDYLKSKIDNPLFFIFSDDIEWCKKTFRDNNINFVDSNFINYSNNAVEDLFLMSCCKHNIVANSTYSWWGGYFNKNPNKIIVCPTKYNTNDNSSEIFPKNWIRCKND